MSRADKERIEELQNEIFRLRAVIGGYVNVIDSGHEREKELRSQLDREKEKYAKLLERYIAMMEKAVKIDEQREAD